MSQTTFTTEEFGNYLVNQLSIESALRNLSAENVIKANDDLRDKLINEGNDIIDEALAFVPSKRG